jgi:hypothetical protein
MKSWILPLMSVTCVLAQAPKAADLTGYWERHDDVGGGSFGGIFDKIIPKVQLTPAVIKANQEQAARQNRGDVVGFGSKWCQTSAYPFFMQHSAAWSIAQSANELVQIAEVQGFTRHVYLDGRAHPAKAQLEGSTTGHAIGRWEGDTLVVDTVGFVGGGTPGGGRIGPGTQLTERFRLVDGGKKLSVTFTWTDPEIYLKPHTYELQYYRSEPGAYAFEEYCHADDPKQSGSVVAPEQR